MNSFNNIFQQIFSEFQSIIAQDIGKRGIFQLVQEQDLYQSIMHLYSNQSKVLILTGFPCIIDSVIPTETDGLTGALYIAKTIVELNQNNQVFIISEEITSSILDFGNFDNRICIVKITKQNIEDQINILLQKCSYIISIERASPASDGHYYSMSSKIMDNLVCPLEKFIIKGKEKNIHTAGIGDGGNEIGMGKIYKLVSKNILNGEQICSSIATDFLIVTGVSNWGGYAISLGLSFLNYIELGIQTNNYKNFATFIKHHVISDELEKEILEILIQQGVKDGITKKQELSIDGFMLSTNQIIKTQLYNTLIKYLTQIHQEKNDLNQQAILSYKQIKFSQPKQLREAIRCNLYNSNTSGQCPGYVQGNIAIIPSQYALDFLNFCKLNSKPCPLLTMSKTPIIQQLGENIDIRYDVGKYRVFQSSQLISQPHEISTIWKDDFVTFILGCSFSFEESLIESGLEIRNITENCNVPMYITNIQCKQSGIFKGNMVVSMRPFLPENAIRAIQICTRFPDVHGSPIHIGDPSYIGIKDINKPDFGDPVTIKQNEIAVFWACGVTPLIILKSSGIPFFITHEPGYMLVTDIKNSTLSIL